MSIRQKNKWIFRIMVKAGFSLLFLFSCGIHADFYEPNKIMDNMKGKQGTPAMEFAYDPNTKISAEIGKKSQTRITFGSYPIKEVVGDPGKYLIVHDNLGQSIFIMPKVKVGEKVNLTLITTGGKVQDFSLLVRDTEGGIISVVDKNRKQQNSDIINNSFLGFGKLEEAKLMLKSMTENRKGKYDVITLKDENRGKRYRCEDKRRLLKSRASKSKCGIAINIDRNDSELSNFKNLEIREREVYRYRASLIKGVVVEIINNTQSVINITEEMVGKIFPRTLLTNIGSREIESGYSTLAFIVVSDTEEK